MTRGLMPRGALALAAGMALTACAYDEGLVPGPRARVVPGAPALAYEERSGVEVQVNGDAWRGVPRDLEKVMTPIRVTVRNRSDRPIRVAYQDLWLETPAGARFNPLPPFSMRTPGPTRTAPISSPMFDHDRFYVASFYSPYYPTLTPWWRTFPYDAAFYDRGYVQWRVQLPTEDMLRAALPEGVIEPGGSVTGFLFFPDVPAGARGIYTVRAEFPAESGEQALASVAIPLVTK